ncbi:MAG: endonuclease domain-containing protein [Alphaproteobacteria bacterium]|nr:endonuclease domain-containing protein [Alphaproteobacteria bacterium]
MSYQYKEHFFVEKYTFPEVEERRYLAHKHQIDRTFFLLHIAAGISYFKAFLPKGVKIDSGRLTKKQAEFFQTFYKQGLGEFLCRNELPFPTLDFPYDENKQEGVFESEEKLRLSDKILLPIGGGKDSVVSLELLRNLDKEITPISAGTAPAIEQVIKLSGLGKHLMIKRELSEHLFELNHQGKVYNGHIPVTGVLAFMLLSTAALYDYKYVVMSNERSANEGNKIYEGVEVNHQWSKSLSFEKAFYEITKEVLADFTYFSLLRGFSEYKIASLFAKLCRPYFQGFTSCNKAFRLETENRLKSWCLNCDKCRFVFLILAPFLSKEELLSIFGKNLLEDRTQEEGFLELLGLQGFKPFECVGEVKESRLAIYKLSKDENWKETNFIKRVLPFFKDDFDALEKELMVPSSLHMIPKEFQHVLS